MAEKINETRPYLQAKCDPTLKKRVKQQSKQSGFDSMSDCLRTIARDFVAGRIRYSGGVYVCPDSLKSS